MKISKLLFVTLFLFLMSCSSNPYYDENRPHHTPSGFKNIYYEVNNRGFLEFIKWRWERLSKKVPGKNDYHFKIDNSLHKYVLANKSEPTLTWIGHATFLLQLEGLNILTDPQFSMRASPISWLGPKRVVPPAIELNDLPDIDAVIISHDHYDSLDVQSVISLSKHNRDRDLTFIVPLGMKSWFEKFNLGKSLVIELDWSESHKIGDIEFTAEPSQHWGKRALFDAFKRLWASWVIETNNYRVFFAGDTGYAEHFSEIGEKYGEFNLALLPIGAYEPRWFMKPFHVNPEEAVKIHLDINSRYSVAMHWGTFILTDEPLDEPPSRLKEAISLYDVDNSTFEVLVHGETKRLNQIEY